MGAPRGGVILTADAPIFKSPANADKVRKQARISNECFGNE
jgi:hypothetical protein